MRLENLDFMDINIKNIIGGGQIASNIALQGFLENYNFTRLTNGGGGHEHPHGKLNLHYEKDEIYGVEEDINQDLKSIFMIKDDTIIRNQIRGMYCIINKEITIVTNFLSNNYLSAL